MIGLVIFFMEAILHILYDAFQDSEGQVVSGVVDIERSALVSYVDQTGGVPGRIFNIYSYKRLLIDRQEDLLDKLLDGKPDPVFLRRSDIILEKIAVKRGPEADKVVVPAVNDCLEYLQAFDKAPGQFLFGGCQRSHPVFPPRRFRPHPYKRLCWRWLLRNSSRG